LARFILAYKIINFLSMFENGVIFYGTRLLVGSLMMDTVTLIAAVLLLESEN